MNLTSHVRKGERDGIKDWWTPKILCIILLSSSNHREEEPGYFLRNWKKLCAEKRNWITNYIYNYYFWLVTTNLREKSLPMWNAFSGKRRKRERESFTSYTIIVITGFLSLDFNAIIISLFSCSLFHFSDEFQKRKNFIKDWKRNLNLLCPSNQRLNPWIGMNIRGFQIKAESSSSGRENWKKWWG